MITLEALSALIDECISELHDRKGHKLYDLAGVFQAIAACNSEPYLFIFPQGVGAFSSELMRSISLTMIPVLPQEVRVAHIKLTDSAIEQATQALEKIKSQFCNSNNTDHEQLMRSIGIFFQQSSILNSQLRRFTETQSSEEG